MQNDGWWYGIIGDNPIKIRQLNKDLEFENTNSELIKTYFSLNDNLKEIKAICHCGTKATMVIRMDEYGNAIQEGAQIEIGGNDRYVSMCRKHFKALFYA